MTNHKRLKKLLKSNLLEIALLELLESVFCTRAVITTFVTCEYRVILIGGSSMETSRTTNLFVRACVSMTAKVSN